MAAVAVVNDPVTLVCVAEVAGGEVVRWRRGAVVRASDCGPRGPWFEPRPVHISLWP